MQSSIIGILAILCVAGCSSGNNARCTDTGVGENACEATRLGGDAAPPAGVEAGSDAAGADAAGADAAGADAGPSQGSSVLTQHNDISRTGANLNETILTTRNVNVGQFGLLGCLPVDDQIYAQPLVVAGLSINGAVKNVLYVATVNDSVYAFDADAPSTAAPLWQASLLEPGESPIVNTDMTKACGGRYRDFSGNIGIVGTPVIDPDSQTMYVVARSKANGSFFQRLHAIDITTGEDRSGSPVTITATVPGTGDGAATVAFNPLHENQRAGLLLSNGVVYVTWAGHCDWPPYHGWVLGYRTSDLAQVIAFNDTANGGEGGIWMSGGGPAADANGNIYLASANGTVGSAGNPGDLTNRAESFLKLVPDAPNLDIASWFTPWDYGTADQEDMDFGISGVLLVPNTNLVVTGAKSGEIFIVDRDDMGGLSPIPVLNTSVQTFNLPILPNQLPNQGPAAFFGAPTFWDSPNGPLLYFWGTSSNLVSYRLDPGTQQFLSSPFSTGGTLMTRPVFLVMLALSANGSRSGSGIVWATHAVGGNPSQQPLPGILRAFDAENLGTELWNSNQDPSRDAYGSFANFGYPTVANGHVYVPTFSQQVCVYGLLEKEPPPSPPPAPANVMATATSNTSVNVSWTDTSGGTANLIVERAEATGPFVSIGGTLPPSTTSLGDSGLVPYATYEYRVRAAWANVFSAYSNTAAVVANGGPPAPALSLSGNGVPIASGSASPVPQDLTDLGAAATGTTASSTFVVVNRGAAPLAISSVAVTGSNLGEFALTHTPTSPLPAGASDSLVVAFAPTTYGEASATIAITSNDPTTPLYSFGIQGDGIGNLVGWWKFNDGSGELAADSSGYENPGTLTTVAGSLPSFVSAGPLKGAILFGGTSYVSIEPDAALSPAQGISVAAWIYPVSALSAAANPRIVEKGAYCDEYCLLVQSGSLEFSVANVGTVAATTLPSASIWTHVAGTYDGSTITLWINGVAVATATGTGPIPTTTDTLLIAARHGSTAAADYFQGAIDDVRVYSAALSAADLATIVAEGAGVGTSLDAGALDASVPAASFASDVQPIFDSACTSCHTSPGPAAGLDLSSGVAYANIVNVPSSELPALDLVEPSDADDSYLYAKVVGGTSDVAIAGDPMPKGGTLLSGAQLATIANWISAGAPNN